jgi:hypothetical protein
MIPRGGHYSVPPGVKTIGTCGFNNSTLESLTLPEDLEAIEDIAMSSMEKLTSLVIPDSVTSIGDCSLYGLHNLTHLTIGQGVTWIRSQVFDQCNNLKWVTIRATRPPVISKNYLDTPYYNFTCTDDTLYVPAGTVGAYRASSWGKVFNRIVEQ